MKIINIITLTALLVASNTTFADTKEGKELHQEHCQKCHTDSVYTRDNRRVHSLQQLGKQVRMCKNNIGIALFPEDVDAVVDYLNKTYYKF